MLFSRRIRVRVWVRVRSRFSVWLVSGYALIFVVLFSVIVSLLLDVVRPPALKLRIRTVRGDPQQMVNASPIWPHRTAA